MDDLLGEFLVESIESISLLDNELLNLEKDPNNKEILKSIFRILHTIKGTCGFIGLSRLEKVAHAGETVLVKLRDEKIVATPSIVTIILECIDAVKYILNTIAEIESEPAGDDEDLIRRLNFAAEGEKNNAGGTQQGSDSIDSSDSDRDDLVSETEFESAGEEKSSDFDDFTFDETFSNEIPDKEVTSAPNATFQTHPDDLDSDEEIFDFYAKQAREKEEQLDKEDPIGEVLVNEEEKAKGVSTKNKRTKAKGAQDISVDAAPFVEEKISIQTDDVAAVSSIDIKNKKIEVIQEKIEVAQSSLKEEYSNISRLLADSTSENPVQENPKTSGNAENAIANSNIRVSVKLLEDLMSQVSELVLTRNQIMQMFKSFDTPDSVSCLRRLDQITSELHEGITKTRMQPISSAWVKLPRLVRDLAIETSKKVELIMIGAETELDRQVIELIKDPLTHMLRNSVDHGLETPDVRTQNGKHESGTITLNAYHEGGVIIIEVSDDGKGLPVDKIKEKAIANGLTTAQFADTLSDTQVYQFIFKPGFSTAEKVTNVSGRGVGMDVVRSNIEKINGTIEVQSVLGQGTQFTIKIPLTLAIVSALLVEVKEHHFAIPQINVQKLIKISENNDDCIDYVSGKPLLRLHEQLIPIVKLEDLLFEEDRSFVNEYSRMEESSYYIIVTQFNNSRIGIVVDKINATQEIVVKPVSSLLRTIPLYSGNAILGDGKIVMILDPNEIGSQMQVSLMKDEEMSSYLADIPDEPKKSKEIFMIFRMNADSPPMAIPLYDITRVETIEISDIESIGEHPLTQYRGQLIPLVILEQPFQISQTEATPLLILKHHSQTIGLVVHAIDDIFEDDNHISIPLHLPGKKGIIVLNGLATDIVDTSYYLEKAYAMFSPEEGDIFNENDIDLGYSNIDESKENA